MTYASLLEDAGPLVSRSAARKHIDEVLDSSLNGAVANRETWGETPGAVAGQEAAMAMFGPKR